MSPSALSASSHLRHFSYVRVLGLTLVLLYHFYPKLLPGGFFGVDIFFVFSGYLITALAIEEFRKTEAFSFKKFAERRFFRIFPTVAFAMLIVLPFTLFGTSDLRYQLKEQVFAGLGFFTNFYEMSTGQAYDNAFAPHIWVHLWSLALEVQFYIFWGLIIWLVARRFKRAMRGLTFLLAALFFIGFCSAMSVSSFTMSSYSFIYYNFFTHSFPFFLGAVLASLAGIQSSHLIRRLNEQWSFAWVRNSAFISGVLLIIFSFFFQFNWKITYTTGFLLVALATTALILFLRLIHEKTESEEPRFIAFIADISYGVYIFHWPFYIIFINYRLSHLLAVLLTLLLSFGLSALMYYGIDPILRGYRKLSGLLRGVLPALTVLLLIPFSIALALSPENTTLSQQLVSGSYIQTSQTLYLTDKYVETGTLGKNILVIGDSVTVGVTTDKTGFANIAQVLPHALTDAQGDKKISSDLDTDLNAYLPFLPDNSAIVIALGTNSTEPQTDISILQSIINKYAAKHPIVLVTPGNISSTNINSSNSNQIANWEVSIEGKYKNVAIADWRAALQGNPQYVDADGIHLSDRPLGRQVWLNTLKEALQSLGVALS